MKQSRFVSHDGKEVELYVWDDVQSPKGVVKIAHGMAEHSARYDEFAKFLNANGFVVVMNDHRGHGLSTDKMSLGYEEGDMWENNVLDQLAVLDYCKEKYPTLPRFMMGHSYGSFINQAVIERRPDVNGFILCGSCYMSGASYRLCYAIARNMCRNRGGRYPAELLANLSFGMYERKIPGKNNWLNRDEKEVALYNADEMCGFVCSANFYRTFMLGIRQLYKKEFYGNIDVEKPILIISGSNDPVGDYSKGVQKLSKFYTEKVGCTDVEMRLYKDARHEILKEQNKQEVFDDVLRWLNENL